MFLLERIVRKNGKELKMDIIILNFINPSNRYFLFAGLPMNVGLIDAFVGLLFMLFSAERSILYSIGYSNFYWLLNKFYYLNKKQCFIF